MFANALSTYPMGWEGTWEDWTTQIMARCPVVADKKQGVAFTPATFSGSRRLLTDVTGIHLAAIDLDGITTDQLTGAVQSLGAKGYTYLWYTSYSHCVKSIGLWRGRFVIPLSRSVTVLEYRDLWPRLRGLFPDIPYGTNQPLDPVLRKPAQIYFTPGIPNESMRASFRQALHPGNPIDVDKFLASECTMVVAPIAEAGSMPCSPQAIRTLAQSCKRSRSPHKQQIGHALLSVIKGDPFAPTGGTDAMVWTLSQYLAETLPSASPESLAETFFTSIMIMNKDWEATHGQPGQMSVAKVAEKIRRAQITIAEKGIARETERLNKERESIRKAWAGIKVARSTSYSEQELEASRAADGNISKEDQATRWVLYKANAIYLRIGEIYKGPFNRRDDGALAAATYLAPAVSAGVNLYTETTTGETVLKTAPSICREYGTLVEEIEVNLACEQTYLDGTKLVESVFAVRPSLTPTYDAAVDHWLRALGGTKQELLLDWLVLAQDLTKPLVMLFLHGAGGSGKSLVAMALSRLWNTQGPAPLDKSLERFNDVVLRNPVLFADEAMPKDFRQNVKWDAIREIIQARTRTLDRKHLPTSPIIGCSRVMGAANNLQGLLHAGHLTEDDIGAISERLLLVHVGGDDRCEAKKFCLSYPAHLEWIEKDTIAMHFRWLLANRPVQRSGRFGVVDPDKKVQRALSMMAGARYYVGLFLVRALLDPQRKAFNGSPPYLVVQNGALFVSSQAFGMYWQLYVNERQPSQKALQQALKSLSSPMIRRPRQGSPVRLRYRQVLTDNLIAFAEDQDEGDAEAILSTLHTVHATQIGLG